MKITSAIFNSEKENVKSDIASCSQTHKHLPALLQVTPHGSIHAQNSVLTCAIKSFCHENAKPFERAVATDQLYSLVSPSIVSPLLFATNLLAYSVTRSKLALNINGKLHPAGGHSTVRNWSKHVKVAEENPEQRRKIIEDCEWRASFVYKSFVQPEILKEQAGRWRGIYARHASNCRTLDSCKTCVGKNPEKTLCECENKEEMSVEML